MAELFEHDGGTRSSEAARTQTRMLDGLRGQGSPGRRGADHRRIVWGSPSHPSLSDRRIDSPFRTLALIEAEYRKAGPRHVERDGG
jgi:hypothetical protein